MFDMFDMIGNYEQRVVANYDVNGIFVDTAAVTDSDKPYETAVEHPNYNNGTMIIVELYDTKRQAKVGHNKWVKLMTSDNLPESIKDVSTAKIVNLAKIFGKNFNIEYTKN